MEEVAGRTIPGPSWFAGLCADWFGAMLRRGRSPTTIRTYGWALRDFGRWLEIHQVAELHHLRIDHVRRWQNSLIARGISPSSQSIASTAVRGLLRWAAREGQEAMAVMWDRVEPVQVPEHEPLVLEQDVLRRLLAHYARPTQDLRRLRDRALFLFLFTSAARIKEALSLDRDDVGRRMVVPQKGGRDKQLVISERAREWLADYLRSRGKDGEPALWVTISGRRRRLRAQEANRIWRRVAADLKLPERFTSRYLRGTAATELHELGAGDLDKAHHLGHRNLASIAKYTKIREPRRQAMVTQLDGLVPQVAQLRVLKGSRRRRPVNRRRPSVGG